MAGWGAAACEALTCTESATVSGGGGVLARSLGGLKLRERLSIHSATSSRMSSGCRPRCSVCSLSSISRPMNAMPTAAPSALRTGLRSSSSILGSASSSGSDERPAPGRNAWPRTLCALTVIRSVSTGCASTLLPT